MGCIILSGSHQFIVETHKVVISVIIETYQCLTLYLGPVKMFMGDINLFYMTRTGYNRQLLSFYDGQVRYHYLWAFYSAPRGHYAPPSLDNSRSAIRGGTRGRIRASCGQGQLQVRPAAGDAICVHDQLQFDQL